MKREYLDVKARLIRLGIQEIEFVKVKQSLDEQWEASPGPNDIAWNLLNSHVLQTRNRNRQRRLYWEMAIIASSEGKNPKGYIENACEYGAFFGYDELSKIRQLVKDGYLTIAENLLMAVEKSPAVLNELRKIFSKRAREAKKKGDWHSVKNNLERYSKLAEIYHDECLKMVNQAPPSHTEMDLALLKKANEKIEP